MKFAPNWNSLELCLKSGLQTAANDIRVQDVAIHAVAIDAVERATTNGGSNGFSYFK